MKPLRYLLYRQLAAEPRKSPWRWFYPLLMASVLLALNSISVAALISEASGGELLANVTGMSIAVTVVPIVAAIYFMMYIAWVRNNRYESFEQEFQNESVRQRLWRSVLIHTYELVSLLSLPLIGVLIHARST
jgi:hypothetical protein